MSESLSRRTQTCAECNQPFSNANNLKRHFERAHPGKICRPKGQNLLNFSVPAKRKHDVNEPVEENNSGRINSDAKNEGDDEPQRSISQETDVSHSLLQELQSVIDQYKTRELISSSENKRNVCVAREGQVAGSSWCNEERHVGESEVGERLRVCYCLNDIETLLSDYFVVGRFDEIVRCLTCVPDSIVHQEASVGIFKCRGVEYERENVQSRNLRHLKEHMNTHLSSATHRNNLEKKKEDARIHASKVARNREIGRKIGSVAYFFFYNKLPYLLFEKFLSLFSLNSIDIGQINHSEHFLRNLLDPCFHELQKRLRTHLNEVIPCTDRERPVALLLDKGTIKHDTSQLTMIRTPCLKGGVLFESFFVGNPIVTENGGLPLTKSLVEIVYRTLNWNADILRERFSGACVDGQYIHLKLGKHLSDLLYLPEDLMDDSVIWDAAHRLELACQHAKEGYTVSGQRVGGTDWLLELDNVLQHIMKIFRFGHNHAHLRKICDERKCTFLEFNLFSETRFVEYSHRTYDHFVRMFPILCEKLKQDEKSATTSKEQSDADSIQNFLVQLELVIDLLFMTDLSHLLTFVSKEFQRFDVLPFHAMNMYWQLMRHLGAARDSFNSLKVPALVPLHESGTKYVVWQALDSGVKGIIESQSFQHVRLLLRSERGRVTRSGTVFGCDKEGFRSIVLQRFKLYRIYLDLLIAELRSRFEPWPEWLELSERALNFSNALEFHDRQESFEKLLDKLNGVNPLLDDEKRRLKAEYVTLHANAMVVLNELKPENEIKFITEKVWYNLLTQERFYRNCKLVNFHCLKFLNRTLNECIVESEVSSVEEIQTSGRRLKDENAEKLNFIASNGPHPLVSGKLVDDMLTNHFGRDWHFTISNSKWFISKTVDRHFQCARNLPNSLQ